VALKRAVLLSDTVKRNLFGARVFGDGFGSFTDGVLGQLARQQETDGGLDFPTGDGRTLVVVSQTTGFGSDTFEEIVDETVHNAHRL